MKRRELMGGLAAAGATLGLAGCRSAVECAEGTQAAERIEWRMYTAWPRNFPGLGVAANRLAESITRMSGGRLRVTVHGAGERVPAMEVFDAVSRGSAQMGHSAAYYWKGKAEATTFFTAMPFGMTAQETNAWLHFGGGMELWRELYAGFNLVPFDAGNTGAQTGGWFRKRIDSLADLRGLRMRIPGIGGEVMARLGVATVNLPGGEIFSALSTGAIDAAEWVGPYNDLAFGFHNAAKYYYVPGWQEPGGALEAIVNKQAWEALPPDLQAVVEAACLADANRMLAEMTARNAEALHQLRTQHNVQVMTFPDEVLRELRKVSDEVIAALVARDAFSAKVWASYKAFLDRVVEGSRIGEHAQMRARDL